MCLYPTLIINRKYTSTKKNKGVIPPINDERVKYVPIGCQQCIECRKQKARQWQVRLLEHIKTNTNGKFITLTFSNKAIEELDREIDTNIQGNYRDNAIATIATRRFLERYRKQHKRSIQHWLVTELGHRGTENIHIHAILWTNDNLNHIEKIWKYGFIWKGHHKNGKLQNYVNESTIGYITKYIMKIDEKHKTFKSKILTSPGIGNNYTNTYNAKRNAYTTNTNELYRTTTGHEITLPIYWRNKIYTEEQREKLWLQKLDKQERWICGEKISIKDGDQQYYKLLEHYRRLNRELGYGNGQITWDREQYEMQRRNIMRETRIQNANKRLRREVIKRERIK